MLIMEEGNFCNLVAELGGRIMVRDLVRWHASELSDIVKSVRVFANKLDIK